MFAMILPAQGAPLLYMLWAQQEVWGTMCLANPANGVGSWAARCDGIFPGGTGGTRLVAVPGESKQRTRGGQAPLPSPTWDRTQRQDETRWMGRSRASENTVPTSCPSPAQAKVGSTLILFSREWGERMEIQRSLQLPCNSRESWITKKKSLGFLALKLPLTTGRCIFLSLVLMNCCGFVLFCCLFLLSLLFVLFCSFLFSKKKTC